MRAGAEEHTKVIRQAPAVPPGAIGQVVEGNRPIKVVVNVLAGSRRFRAPVSHGLLTASLLTEIGGQIGWLASGMTFHFKQPVYAGDTITCHWLITGIDEKDRATAAITMTNEDDIIVLEAETSGVVPGVKEREILTQMLREGDPTNGVTAPGG
ncbi:FAS1-like dehydratase domain-containing protein [Pseudomonas sp. LB3P25]